MKKDSKVRYPIGNYPQEKAIRIHKKNLHENGLRKEFQYKHGVTILLDDSIGEKLSPKSKDPFQITELHTNVTVTIQLKPQVCNA